eukprot:TRINITY_DN10346_c0_g1_i3.p1 TRINITY_DN10346_c0_g1~~TRINITY_DN10346_c0_g1_i3.p1  ORF type:complete len:134 (-),score=23.64 TRINITY_DN10346_c0_g1_i3:58-459(-)
MQYEDLTSEDYPRNAQLMVILLRSMGIKEWEPRVLNQLLEFMYSYVSDVMNDSKDYASHAGRTNLDISDVRLAVESKTAKCQTPPDRQELIKIARRKNETPLPLLQQRVPGVLLPPDEYCLLKENYQVVSQPK